MFINIKIPFKHYIYIFPFFKILRTLLFVIILLSEIYYLPYYKNL